MNPLDDFPSDFNECVRFHGHLCPGLAIGYSAVKAATRLLNVGPSRDEEVVAVVENDSCAVDAIQVLLGCTFGKGNLFFRDWGKQVFTFMDRKTGRAVRVSLTRELPGRTKRHALKKKIEAGLASNSETKLWDELRYSIAKELIASDPELYFEVREVRSRIPPAAEVVETRPCAICGEGVMSTRLVTRQELLVCQDCANI